VDESKWELLSDYIFPLNLIVLGVEEQDNEVKLYCHPSAVAYLTVTSHCDNGTVSKCS